MIGFLKEDVRTDTGIPQFTIILHRSGSDVHIHPAYCTVLMLDTVDSLDGLQDIIDRIAHGVFSGFQCQTLMPHILQGNHFLFYLLLREFLAGNSLVLQMIRAIHASIHTVIGQVQRCEHHDTVAVELMLNLPCQMEDTLDQVGLVTLQQQGGFPV